MQTKMTGQKTSAIVMTAMMMCIIMVAIFLFRIPIPFTQGYVNLSDGVIFIAVILLGRKYGVASAALGSMLGDIIGGFAMWAPWTFMIKGGMALIMATIILAFAKSKLGEGKRWMVRIGAMACGGMFMVFGYFIAERIMYGSWAIAALGIPWNVGQFVVGIILAVCILKALHKTSVIDKDVML
ncbi:MAG: ECF transporter S component [Bacillota bacterium]|nr:ECF transporter S component [Bacillota bacterium]